LFLFLTLLTAPNLATAASSRSLSLRQVLQELLQRNPSLRRERLTLQQSDADILIAKGAFGFDLSLNLDLNHNATPPRLSNSVLGLAEITADSWSLNGGVELTKLFETGTVLKASFTQGWNLQNSLFKVLDVNNIPERQQQSEGANSRLSLSVVQPLLKGAWSTFNLIPVWQAQEQRKIAREQIRNSINQLVGQAVRAYWDLIYARKFLDIQKSNFKLAQEQLKSTKAFIQSGKVAALERFQVEQVIAARRLDLLTAKDSVDRAEVVLKQLLFLPPAQRITPQGFPARAGDFGSLTSLLAKTRKRNSQLLVAEYQKRIARLNVRSAKNGMLPKLDLTANFTLLGQGNARDSKNGGVQVLGNSLGTMIDPRSHDFRLGVVLTIPLDQRAAKNRLTRSRIETHRARLLVKLLRRQLDNEIGQLFRQVKRIEKRLPLARISIDWARKKLSAEQEKYKAGKSTLSTILQYQQDLAQARLVFLKNRVDVQKARCSLFEKIGTLLDRYGIGRLAR
jgi:outer membrane protein TolC